MELSLILSYLRPYRLHLVGALLSVALFTLVQLVVPWYAGSSVNEIIRTRSIGVLDRTALVVLAFFALRSLFMYLQVYLTHYLAHRTVADVRQDLFASVQRWSLDRFAAWETGDAISRTILDTQLLQTHLLMGAAEFIATGLMLTGIVIALFGLQWKLALVVCAVIPLVFIIARLVGREIQQVAGRAQRHIADLASTIKEAFTGALVIRAFTQEERQLARFREENRQAPPGHSEDQQTAGEPGAGRHAARHHGCGRGHLGGRAAGHGRIADRGRAGGLPGIHGPGRRSGGTGDPALRGDAPGPGRLPADPADAGRGHRRRRCARRRRTGTRRRPGDLPPRLLPLHQRTERAAIGTT